MHLAPGVKPLAGHDRNLASLCLHVALFPGLPVQTKPGNEASLCARMLTFQLYMHVCRLPFNFSYSVCTVRTYTPVVVSLAIYSYTCPFTASVHAYTCKQYCHWTFFTQLRIIYLYNPCLSLVRPADNFSRFYGFKQSFFMILQLT